MKRFVISSLFLVSMAQGAYADCWDECVARNPINGGCVARTKVCNVEDAGRAAYSLGSDIHKGYQGLQETWHGLYGQIPAPLREVLNRYPVTIAAAVYPGTREYVLVTAVLERYFRSASDRAKEIQPVYEAAPDWKKNIIVEAQALLLIKGRASIRGVYDWNDPAAEGVRVAYAAEWRTFSACIAAAQTPPEGDACYNQLDDSTVRR